MLSRIKALRNKYRKLVNEKPNPNDPIWVSYSLLLKALNQLNGYRYYIEKDPSNWIGFKGGVSLGINITSISNADSKISKKWVDWLHYMRNRFVKKN